MNHLLWGLQIFLAGAFWFTAAGKLFDYDQLVAVIEVRSKGRPIGVSKTQALLLGIVEAVGATGLLAPSRLDPHHWVVINSAAALGFVMAAAVVYHWRRRESFVPALVFMMMNVLVFLGRWAL